MNSGGIKKRIWVLLSAVVMSISSTYAATTDNKIINLKLFENNSLVRIVIITEKTYTGTVKAVKSGEYYNVILPNLGNGINEAYKPTTPNVDFIKVTTLPSSTGSGSYTRVSIKAAPGVIVFAEARAANPEDLANIEQQNQQKNEEQQRLLEEQRNREQQSDFETENDTIYEEEENIEEDEYIEEPETPQPQPETKTEANEPSPPPPQAAPPVKQTRPLSTGHTSEILYILIGTAAILLVVILLYIKGKDKIQELCGDMNINIDDNKKAKENKTQKNKQTKPKAKQESPIGMIDLDYSYNSSKKETARTSTISQNEETEETVIDLDEIYAGPKTPVLTSKIEPDNTEQTNTGTNNLGNNNISPDTEDEDIDDFLSAFVDEEDEEYVDNQTATSNSTTKPNDINSEDPALQNENITDNPENINLQTDIPEDNLKTQLAADTTINNEDNPIDNLIDDVITTQNMSFTDSDIDAITTKLQADMSSEIMQTLPERANETPHQKLTVEEFDKKYPLLSDNEINNIINNKNIKFNDIDINVIFSPITSYEMSEDAILEAKLRKERVDEENIQYYENEQDFAFTLIKTQDVQNPDELVVLDNNVYPDLENVDFSNDDIFKEFSFAKPDFPDMPNSDTAPTTEDIDNAIAHEMEMINKQKQFEENKQQEQAPSDNDPILSEFKLIKPEIEVPRSDEHFSTTIFTSMDDIEAQFKALGVEFSSDETEEPAMLNQTNPAAEIVEPSEENNMQQQELSTITTDTTDEKMQSDEQIYASCNIDFSTELYITSYENHISLIGMKNGTITKLYDFNNGEIPKKLTARKAEETENGSIRYIVRADKEKFVIDISDNDIKMVLAL